MDQVLEFVHETDYEDFPPRVRRMAEHCLLDVVGALCAGRLTGLSRIVSEHALEAFGGDQATVLLDGRRCSAPGAALANGMTIDAMDIHDSYRESLGHAGVHVFPTVLAIGEQLLETRGRQVTGREFLAAMVVGYEIACRAAVILHATVPDYHTSGAWGAVSSAALYARLHGLDSDQTRHAMGIAEYHGPRSQMMRVIDHPTMLKDGSGWGAMTGVSAGMLATRGFTGAPAITVESPDVAEYWEDLGQRWLILEQGFKTHAVCWWAQPAIEGALRIMRDENLSIGEIGRIEVETFDKATRLAHPRPTTTEAAQYSLPYPLAAALWNRANSAGGWDGVGPLQLLEGYLFDERVLALSDRVALVEAPDLTTRFPGEFLARVRIDTLDGSVFDSGETTFRGEPDHPLSDSEVREKYRWLAGQVLATDRVEALEEIVFDLSDQGDIGALLKCLAPRPERIDS